MSNNSERTDSGGVKLSLNFSSHPPPITGPTLVSELLWFARVSCPRSDWQPGGKTFCVCVAPSDLKGAVRDDCEGATLLNGGAAVQDSSEEQRGEELCGRDGLSIRQPAGGTHTTNPYGCLRNNDTPPLPLFLSFSGTFGFLVLSWAEVVASLISCSRLKSESTCRGRLWRSWIPI